MSPPPEPLESISAVTLVVGDMAAATAFYAALGFSTLYGGADAMFTSLRVGVGYLNLQFDPQAQLQHGNWGRIVFWVHDVDEMFRRVVSAGFVPETEPSDAPWGERYFHIRDRDGHELSFARRLD